MKMPPLFMRLRIKDARRSFRLWLPLFIIFPLVGIIAFALFVVVLPFVLLAAIFQWRLWRTVVFFWPYLVTLIISLRDLEIDVQDDKQRFYLSFK